jgi:hypothetical protein
LRSLLPSPLPFVECGGLTPLCLSSFPRLGFPPAAHTPRH